jgi:pimeloyl-ACP methyl ester carboxylesterase
MSGTGRDFRRLIETLDLSRFQPWVFQYPSALPIGLLAEFLARALTEQHTTHHLARTCLIGHSMGGLVARAALNHLPSDLPIGGLATIASPLAGVEIAGAAPRWLPAVAPAWIDLAPESRFLKSLYASPLPPTVTYHLVFSYRAGSSSDGVVETASQLRVEAQEEADVVRGVEVAHRAALADERVFELLGRFLDRCSAEGVQPAGQM